MTTADATHFPETLCIVFGLLFIIIAYASPRGIFKIYSAILGVACCILSLIILVNTSKNPPYRFKPVPPPKTTDTLYNNIEVHGDTTTTTLKIVKLN